MATVFVFPSFGAVVGAPVGSDVDEPLRAERDAHVAVETQSGDDEAA
jgi:hypothetical protein